MAVARLAAAEPSQLRLESVCGAAATGRREGTGCLQRVGGDDEGDEKVVNVRDDEHHASAGPESRLPAAQRTASIRSRAVVAHWAVSAST